VIARRWPNPCWPPGPGADGRIRDLPRHPRASAGALTCAAVGASENDFANAHDQPHSSGQHGKELRVQPSVVGAKYEVDRHDAEQEADSDETEAAPDSLACSSPGGHGSTIATLLVWTSRQSADRGNRRTNP
jgi:hypothetical protein